MLGVACSYPITAEVHPCTQMFVCNTYAAGRLTSDGALRYQRDTEIVQSGALGEPSVSGPREQRRKSTEEGMIALLGFG